MIIKPKKFLQNIKILKILFFAPFLISIPLFYDNALKAGLEFQWDQDSGYRRLKWFQKNESKRARNKIFIFFSFNSITKYFDKTIILENIKSSL